LLVNVKQLQEIEKKNGFDLKRLENEQEKKIQQNLKLEIDIVVSKEEQDKLQVWLYFIILLNFIHKPFFYLCKMVLCF
jgi:hypothetical protein